MEPQQKIQGQHWNQCLYLIHCYNNNNHTNSNNNNRSNYNYAPTTTETTTTTAATTTTARTTTTTSATTTTTAIKQPIDKLETKERKAFVLPVPKKDSDEKKPFVTVDLTPTDDTAAPFVEKVRFPESNIGKVTIKRLVPASEKNAGQYETVVQAKNLMMIIQSNSQHQSAWIRSKSF
ncbi:DgyrCDS6476 [Dimorphilus gyrociliatus]|uniref:DgyrCDS6476 n=1 Tax=Dimorphilus gyrociliatus TaxID=2664684 RepID=A0A7I8VNB7_9ANNE|nr:DgyrCDS6476 [Dimorphilus gyrociliatus]